MHRPDSEGVLLGRFTEGNPQVGQLASILGAKWLNMLVEEFAHLVTFAGFALDDQDDQQVRKAIAAIATGAAGAGGGSVPTSRTVTGGGLVTGGGPLVANLILSVLQATVAETAAQVRNDVAVTPASLAGLITTQTSGGAQMTKIGSLYIQSFSSTASGNGSSLHNLPFAFPNSFLQGFCNGGRLTANAQDNPPFVSGGTTTTMSVFSAIDDPVGISLLALGN